MMRPRLMGLVGLALASAFIAKEAHDKAQDTVIRAGQRAGKSALSMRAPSRRGRGGRGKFGPARLRRLRRAAARMGRA